MDKRIREAFDTVRADDALLEGTLARVQAQSAPRRSRGTVVRLRLAAVAAALLVMAGLGGYQMYFAAASYVSLDVNPSVELTLNRMDRVIGSHAFNGEGEEILGGLGLWGKRYDQAAGLLVSAMESGGYLSGEALVAVTVQAPDSREEKLGQGLWSAISGQLLSAGWAAEVEVTPVDAQVWESAHGCHMSPAKYLAIQELMEVDEGATLEDYGHHSIQQIRQRTQQCRSGHGEGGSGGHGKGHGRRAEQ